MRKGHLTVLLTSISFAKYSCRNSVSIVKSNQLRFTSSLKSKTFMDVYIALGSNIGDRSFAICQAIQELRAIGDVKSTSFLYETVPMYHSDQGNFFNAACLLQTKLQPLELLIEIQRIEKDVGRTTTFQNGPRIIDLDILMYSDMRIDTEQLQVPHPRIAERCFVLRPLCDIAGTAQLTDPCGRVYSISELYHKLPQASKDEVRRVSPVYNHLRKQTQFLKDSPKQQQIMGILNVTPDSFSDGGAYNEDVSAAVRQALRMEAEGAAIIDIGGESTRPGASTIPVEEELRRVIPVISAIRAAGSTCMISVDTRKAEVAKQAILAGADMVNDVSAGKFDPLMLPTVGALPGVPFVAMHMRGDPQTMQQPQHLRYRIEHENKQQLKNKQEQEPGINIFSCAGSELDGQQQSTARRTPATALFASADPATAGYGAQVVQVVAGELAEQLAVVDAHIPRWLQLVDPGIGFAKGYDENTALLQPDQLRRFKELLGGRSMVVGFSRKKFINRVIGESKARRGLLDSEDAVAYSASVEEKDLATAVTCSNLVGVADIVRVHDVASTRTACDVQQAFK